MNQGPIPGTHEPNWIEPPFVERSAKSLTRLAGMGSKGLKVYEMGECNIILAREPIGVNGEMLWHLTISHPHRHPVWDEIKTARYRLLPLELTFGMLLGPPRNYVNLPSQNHVFHLHEIHDVREPWAGG